GGGGGGGSVALLSARRGGSQRVSFSTSGGSARRHGTSRPRTSTTTSSLFLRPASSEMNASAIPAPRVGEYVPELVTPTSAPPARTVCPARRTPRPVTSRA